MANDSRACVSNAGRGRKRSRCAAPIGCCLRHFNKKPRLPERLGLTFADEYPPYCRVASGARRRGPLWAIVLGLNIRSEIFEYVVEGLILGFFKHVQFA